MASVNDGTLDQLSDFLTALALTDNGARVDSKLWTSPEESCRRAAERLCIPQISLPDAQQSISALLSATSSSSLSSSQATLDKRTPNAWVRKNDQILSLVEREAKSVLDSMSSQATSDTYGLRQLITSASKVLDRGGKALIGVMHATLRARKAEVLLLLETIRRRIEELQPQLPMAPPSAGPVPVDTTHLDDDRISSLDSIAQVMILLGVVCNVIIGLSSESCDFIIGVATMLVKMAMAGVNKESSNSYTSLQQLVINQLPTSLYTATSRFGLDSLTTTFATCPSCSYTQAPIYNRAYCREEYAAHCQNRLAGPKGAITCGTELLETRKGNKILIKPYVLQSFSDFLVRIYSDSEVE